MTAPRPAKMPVPAAWQPAVLLALDDLGSRLGLGVNEMAVTRVEETSWWPAPGPADKSMEKVARHGLSIWLMARGRTHRYRSDAATGSVVADSPAT